MENYKSVKVVYTNSSGSNGISSTHIPAFPRVSIENIHQQIHYSEDIGDVNIPLEFEEFSNHNNDFDTIELRSNQAENRFPVYLGMIIY
jgi:hypothetical protein